MALYAWHVAGLGSVEDKIVDCFFNGGGVPYSAFHRFHEVIPFDGIVAFGQVIPLTTASSEQNIDQTAGVVSVNNAINAFNAKRHKRHPRPLPRRRPQPGQRNRASTLGGMVCFGGMFGTIRRPHLTCGKYVR